MAQCKYCGTEIVWTKEGKKFTPITSDGEIHECDGFKSAKNSFKRMTRDSLTPEEIARYEDAMNKKK